MADRCDRTDVHHHHEAQTGGTYAEDGPAWKCPTPWATDSACPGPKAAKREALYEAIARRTEPRCTCLPENAAHLPRCPWFKEQIKVQRWVPTDEQKIGMSIELARCLNVIEDLRDNDMTSGCYEACFDRVIEALQRDVAY